MQALYKVSVNASIQQPIPNDEVYTGYALRLEYNSCVHCLVDSLIRVRVLYMYATTRVQGSL
jgi:hypothetical protein